MTTQGGGLVDAGAAAAGEIAASPGTLALGRSTGAGWRVNGAFALTNVTTRTLSLTARRPHAGRGRRRRRLHRPPAPRSTSRREEHLSCI